MSVVIHPYRIQECKWSTGESQKIRRSSISALSHRQRAYSQFTWFTLVGQIQKSKCPKKAPCRGEKKGSSSIPEFSTPEAQFKQGCSKFESTIPKGPMHP
jgi:hypothetical protein